MSDNQVLEQLKKPLIEFIEQNLPVSYFRYEADGSWRVTVTENGELQLEDYAKYLTTKTWKELPLRELAYLAESKLGLWGVWSPK